MKIVSILGACAIIAGASAYAMHNYSDSHRNCGGCPTAVAATEPCCSGHDSDEGTCAVASRVSSCCDSAKVVAKATDSCCPASACCPTGPCCDATLAVAGPAALAGVSKVSATVKKSCCGAGACGDDDLAVSAVAGFGAAVKAAK